MLFYTYIRDNFSFKVRIFLSYMIIVPCLCCNMCVLQSILLLQPFMFVISINFQDLILFKRAWRFHPLNSLVCRS